MRFRCYVANARGLTWSFAVDNPNWCGLRAVSEEELKRRVASDPMHQKHGPWSIVRIDVSAD